MCNLSKGVEEKGIQKGIKKGIQKGIEKGIEQGIEKGILLSIRNLMETMGWSVEQAMESLKIPEEEKTKYMKLISTIKKFLISSDSEE